MVLLNKQKRELPESTTIWIAFSKVMDSTIVSVANRSVCQIAMVHIKIKCKRLDYLLLFIALALVAEILGTVGGFGSSVFFVPIAALFLDFYSVLGITAIFHVTSNLTKIAMFRHGFDKNLLIYLGIPATIFVLLGAYLSKFIIGQELEIGLAIFLIILSTLFLIFKKISLKPNKTNSIIGAGFYLEESPDSSVQEVQLEALHCLLSN